MMGMDFIKFLGTAGARFVVSKQLRSSGGVWLSLAGKNVLIDPGPGTLVKCHSSKPKLDPAKLDAIILTHRHLDHSCDVNIIVEAMTDGGFKRHGILFVPGDALSAEAVVFSYIREFPEKVEILREGGNYTLGELRIETPIRHRHRVETYGLNISTGRTSISLIADTLYFEGLEKHYRGDIMILNVVLLRQKEDRVIDHLTLSDAEILIGARRPKLAILTHFGMGMVQAKPWELAAALEEKLGSRVLAARDGMTVNIDEALV